MRLIVILFYFVLYFLVFVIPITLLMLYYVLIEKKIFFGINPSYPFDVIASRLCAYRKKCFLALTLGEKFITSVNSKRNMCTAVI